MSDNWLRYVPRDAYFRPSAQAADAAQRLLASMLPEAEEVVAQFFEQPAFIDCGSNWSGVNCPACSADIEEWWESATSSVSESGFTTLEVITPCCGAKSSLNNLAYVWPAAFGVFVLDAMNPNIKSLPGEQLDALGNCLGCKLQEIAQHL